MLSLKEGGGFFAAFSRDQPEKVYVQHKGAERKGVEHVMLWCRNIRRGVVYQNAC